MEEIDESHRIYDSGSTVEILSGFPVSSVRRIRRNRVDVGVSVHVSGLVTPLRPVLCLSSPRGWTPRDVDSCVTGRVR